MAIGPSDDPARTIRSPDVSPGGSGIETGSPAGAETVALLPLSVSTRTPAPRSAPASPATTTMLGTSTGSSSSIASHGRGSSRADCHRVSTRPSKAENGWNSGITSPALSAKASDDDAVTSRAPSSSARVSQRPSPIV